MDLKKRYFYITIHFTPDYSNEFNRINEDIWINTLTGEQFRKRLLYNFGWGRETGFEIFPPLAFLQLIELVEKSTYIRKKQYWEKYSQDEILSNTINQNNLFGAISVIMQDHRDEFIDFLSDRISSDYFSNSLIRENYKWFCFSTKIMREKGFFTGGIGTKSYETVLNENEKWRVISQKVIDQVYPFCVK